MLLGGGLKVLIFSWQNLWLHRSRVIASVLFILTIFTNVLLKPLTVQAATINKSVGGWVVYWGQTRGFNLVQNNNDIFDEISPFWYDVNASGAVVPLWNSENTTIINWSKSKGIKIIPLISNEFSGRVVSGIINNPSLKQTHINNLVNKVMAMGYDGIELDYENLFAADKNAYSAFVKDLADELHSRGKLLVVTVHPKTESVGTWSGPKAHDYVALGQVADKIRIMAYDYHYGGGTPGSIAPATWVEEVLVYSVTAIPKNKIVLGIPNYGYDWGPASKGLTYQQTINTAKAYGAKIIEDPINGPHYTYSANGVKHEVWFEDTLSLKTKLDLVNKYDINGIVIWRLGGEDLTNYQAIREKFTTVANEETATTASPVDSYQLDDPIATSIEPIVVNPEVGIITPIVSPRGTIPENPVALTPDPVLPRVLTKPKQPVDKKAPILTFKANVSKNTLAIKAIAKDNVKVAKVNFYIDGKLKFTDKTAAYNFKYKVKRLNRKHIIKVIAVDSRGNITKLSKVIKW